MPYYTYMSIWIFTGCTVTKEKMMRVRVTEKCYKSCTILALLRQVGMIYRQILTLCVYTLCVGDCVVR